MTTAILMIRSLQGLIFSITLFLTGHYFQLSLDQVDYIAAMRYRLDGIAMLAMGAFFLYFLQIVRDSFRGA